MGQAQRGCRLLIPGDAQPQLCLALLSAELSCPNEMLSLDIWVFYAIYSVGLPKILSSLLQLQCFNTQQSCEDKLLRKLQLKITSVSLGMPEPVLGFLWGDL